jgi:hypothetical protein
MAIYRYCCRACGRTFDTTFASVACPSCDAEDLDEEVTQAKGRDSACENGGDCGACGACDPSFIRE